MISSGIFSSILFFLNLIQFSLNQIKTNFKIPFSLLEMKKEYILKIKFLLILGFIFSFTMTSAFSHLYTFRTKETFWYLCTIKQSYIVISSPYIMNNLSRWILRIIKNEFKELYVGIYLITSIYIGSYLGPRSFKAFVLYLFRYKLLIYN